MAYQNFDINLVLTSIVSAFQPYILTILGVAGSTNLVLLNYLQKGLILFQAWTWNWGHKKGRSPNCVVLHFLNLVSLISLWSK